MAFDESGAFRALDLFADFSDEQLRLLNFASETMALSPGDILYQSGEASTGAYALISGQLEAQDGATENAPKFIIDPPALVGEMGLMLSRPRPATVIARRQSELLYIPREPFLKILRSDPDLAASVAEFLRAELAAYLDRVTRSGAPGQ